MDSPYVFNITCQPVGRQAAKRKHTTTSQHNNVNPWKELNRRQVPAWYADATLGVLVRWGVASVPGLGSTEQWPEWFALDSKQRKSSSALRRQAEDAQWLAKDDRVKGGDLYRLFAPLFRARHFVAREWAALFRRAGMRYVVLSAKQGDGYAMWPSTFAPGWNSGEVG